MFDLDYLKQYFRELFDKALSEDGWLVKLWPLWSLFLVCLTVVLFTSPMKAFLVIYGIGKILLGVLLGLIARWGINQLLPAPDPASGIADGLDRKCATWLVCACVIAIVIGVP